MPSESVHRRAFCVRACQSVSAVTLASLAEACGGQTPTSPIPDERPGPAVGGGPATPNPPVDPTPPSTSAPTPPSTGVVSAVPLVRATVLDGQLLVAVDSTSPLAVTAGVALVHAFVRGIFRDVLLTRLGADRFSALNAICTHEGCIVSQVAGSVFVCPCHGSQYDMTGTVVQGPAPAALPRLPVRYADGVLTVEV